MRHIDVTKYIGIPFRHRGSNWSGVDCYGLVRLFYKTEFNIFIPDYIYDENWCTHGFDWIHKYYKENWIKIDKPKRYGGIGFKYPGQHVEHHLGIVLWDLISFLHCPKDKAVCVSKLSDRFWKRSIYSFYDIKEMECQQS